MYMLISLDSLWRKMAPLLGTLPAAMVELLNKVQQVHQQSSQFCTFSIRFPRVLRFPLILCGLVELLIALCVVTDELLLMLKFIFGPPALQALELVDQRSVTLVDSPSGRSVYQVVGSSGQVYHCLNSCLYCSCAAFTYSVLRRNDHLLCKHLLAVHLCQAMGIHRQLRVSNQQLTNLLQVKDKELKSTE